MVTKHAPVPLQPSPLQPAKVEVTATVAVRVTLELRVKAPVHVAPQSMPAGLLVTVPVPVPALVTVREKDGATAVVPLSASARPKPNVESKPGAPRSIEVPVKAFRSACEVNAGLSWINNAAIAATCGAAAEVPQKGFPKNPNTPTSVVTQSMPLTLGTERVSGVGKLIEPGPREL